MVRAATVLLLGYLGMGVSTAAFLFHLPVALRRLDPDAERVRIARSVPPLARLLREGGPELACRAVAVGIVALWPLFLVPLLRWMGERTR
ncbi:MAG: hypothetical protein Kow0092_10390 [Deferrisomatales bacterium]